MGTYTLQDYNNIIFNGFDFKLSSSVIQHIHDLASQVGSPSYIKTPTFQKRDKSNNSPRRKDGSKGSDSSSQNKSVAERLNPPICDHLSHDPSRRIPLLTVRSPRLFQAANQAFSDIRIGAFQNIR